MLAPLPMQGVAGAERMLASAVAATAAKRGEVERAKATLAAAEERLAAAKDKAKGASPTKAPAAAATAAASPAANGVAVIAGSSSNSPAGTQPDTPAENNSAGAGAVADVAAAAPASPAAPGLSLPPHLVTYSGPDDRKKRMAWERERKEALAELEGKK
jgi:hypothetical protein